MDREHVKGAADKVKGAIKETAGKMTGDREMQAEGSSRAGVTSGLNFTQSYRFEFAVAAAAGAVD